MPSEVKTKTKTKTKTKSLPSKAGVILLNESATQMLVVMNHEAVEAGDNKLGLPKGHRNPNEQLYACASRELKEETGIMIRIHPKDPCVVVSDTAYFILKVFKHIDTNPQDSKEIHSSTWEPIVKLLNATTNRGLRMILQKYKNDESFRKTLSDVKPRLAICMRKSSKDKALKNDRYSDSDDVISKRLDVRCSTASSTDSGSSLEIEAEVFSEGIRISTDGYGYDI
jgi:8-oxo-dGTP pyrophosphatase MutT (NUDIX family)